MVAKQELMAQAWDSSLVREMLARAEGEAPGGRNAFRPEGLLPEYGMQDSGSTAYPMIKPRKFCKCACSA